MSGEGRFLFVSDLHLNGEQPEILRLFLDFLEGPAREAEGLYILGDLFEAWLGDDLVLPEYQPVIDAFQRLTRLGTATFVMHGNRDFLLGERFEAMTGCRLIQEPYVLERGSKRALLLHGDTLCTDDHPYQQLRAQLRNRAWIDGFLAKSGAERIAFARHLREKSREATSQKVAEIMDVNQQTVVETMEQHQVEVLIHGHTHRPAIHQLGIEGRHAERIVLGDWGTTGSVLEWKDDGFRLGRFPG